MAKQLCFSELYLYFFFYLSMLDRDYRDVMELVLVLVKRDGIHPKEMMLLIVNYIDHHLGFFQTCQIYTTRS